MKEGWIQQAELISHPEQPGRIRRRGRVRRHRHQRRHTRRHGSGSGGSGSGRRRRSHAHERHLGAHRTTDGAGRCGLPPQQRGHRSRYRRRGLVDQRRASCALRGRGVRLPFPRRSVVRARGPRGRRCRLREPIRFQRESGWRLDRGGRDHGTGCDLAHCRRRVGLRHLWILRLPQWEDGPRRGQWPHAISWRRSLPATASPVSTSVRASRR